MKPVILTILSSVKDFGEITLALLGVIAGAVWFVFKKIVEYIQLKNDIKDIQTKLDLLLSKQGAIILDIELIKHDMTYLGHKQIRRKQKADEKENQQ